jgi:hypothetical protein
MDVIQVKFHCRGFFTIFVWLIFLSSFPCMSESDDKPGVRQFKVIRDADEFLVTAVLQPAVTPEIRDRILTGTPTTFEYMIHLKKVRWYWDNKILAHATYQHTVTYDTLRKTFKVVVNREGVDEIVLTKETKNQTEMESLMSSFTGTLVYPSSELIRDAQYYISISASLTTRQIPPPWSLFLSNDFKTQTNRKYFP